MSKMLKELFDKNRSISTETIFRISKIEEHEIESLHEMLAEELFEIRRISKIWCITSLEGGRMGMKIQIPLLAQKNLSDEEAYNSIDRDFATKVMNFTDRDIHAYEHRLHGYLYMLRERMNFLSKMTHALDDKIEKFKVSYNE